MTIYIVVETFYYESSQIMSVHKDFKEAQKSMYETFGIEYTESMIRSDPEENNLTKFGYIINIEEWEI